MCFFWIVAVDLEMAVYFPILYYCAYFSVRADDFDLVAMSKGKDAVKERMKEITDKSIEELDETMLDNLVTWQYNGSKTTIDEFRKLDTEGKMGVIDFIKELLIYEEISVGDKDYLLVHAGLGNYSPQKDIEYYSAPAVI